MTIDDIPVIAPYFRFVTTNTCDFTVGGMFMWRDYFHMAWQVEYSTPSTCPWGRISPPDCGSA